MSTDVPRIFRGFFGSVFLRVFPLYIIDVLPKICRFAFKKMLEPRVQFVRAPGGEARVCALRVWRRVYLVSISLER